MRHTWTNRLGRLLAILLLALVSGLMLAAPARATGDTVAISITNGSSFTYGGPAPVFTVVVTLGTKLTANYFLTAYVDIDSRSNPPSSASIDGGATSSDGLTVTFTGIRLDTSSSPLLAGHHTAVAHFANPETKVTSYSSSVGFDVAKAPLDFACAPSALQLPVGQPVHVQLSTGNFGTLPTETLGSTFGVIFSGATNYTTSNLTPDSGFMVTANAPTQTGLYQIKCTFSGSANYAPTTSPISSSHYTFSLMRSLGTVQLYSSPTTLTGGQTMTFKVVFHPAAGLPMPTGQFSIWYGSSYYTNSNMISPSGVNTVQVSPIPGTGGVDYIEIFYMGDVNYNQAHVRFPLTNPPLSASGVSSGTGGTGGTGANPQGTTTAQGTASASTTPGSDTTPTTVSVGGALSSPTQQSNGSLPFILILALVGLLVGVGAVGGGIYLLRRARVASGVGTQTPGDFYVPTAHLSPNEDTWPPLRRDG